MTYELWKHVLRVELDLVFNVTNAAWRHLQQDGGGSIINTASVAATHGIAALGQAAHAAAKGAVIALTKTLAAEGAAVGIRANAISSGLRQIPCDGPGSRRARPQLPAVMAAGQRPAGS